MNSPLSAITYAPQSGGKQTERELLDMLIHATDAAVDDLGIICIAGSLYRAGYRLIKSGEAAAPVVESREQMRVMAPPKGCPDFVPFAVLSNTWAEKNHSQSLLRLNQRGGMDAVEIAANIERKGLHPLPFTLEQATAVINAAMKEKQT